jgi:hypothetical protein
MKFTKVLATGGALVCALLFSAQASAAVVPCDPTYPGATRSMELDVTGTIACFDSGLVNENYPDLIYKNNFGGAVEGPGPNPFEYFTGNGGTSGTFKVTAPGAGDFLLVFKFGGGQADPDWFSYNFSGTVEGSWSVTGNQALSHYSVYGVPSEVPEPATLALLGMGLVGFGLARRRRKI